MRVSNPKCYAWTIGQFLKLFFSFKGVILNGCIFFLFFIFFEYLFIVA